MMKRAIINCPENGTSGSVVWFPGTDDKSIYASFCAACRIDPSEAVSFSEEKGSPQNTVCLVVNEFLPDGIRVCATLPKLTSVGILSEHQEEDTPEGAESSPLLSEASGNKPTGASDSAGQGDFQGQLLKFNRINAHLANERTYLAWARTVMSVLSVVFTLRTEAKDSFNMSWSIVWFVMSCLFMFSANYTWFNGWTRYVRVKEICLTSDLREAEQKMQRDGLGFSRLSMLTYIVAGLLVITTIVYCVYGTVDEVWEY